MDPRRTEPPRRRAARIALATLAAAAWGCGDEAAPADAVRGAVPAAARPAAPEGSATSARPAPPTSRAVPVAVDPLPSIDLGGTWELLLDPADEGRGQGWVRGDHPAWSRAVPVAVPGALETAPGAADFDGVAWYRRRLPAAPAPGAARVLLAFEGANDRVEAWLGGQPLGTHEGSDVAFRFDVTGRLDRPGALLVVRVVDPGEEEIEGMTLSARPHAKESWYVNYGGLTGAVRLAAVPPVELRAHDVSLVDGVPRARLVLHSHHEAARDVRVELAVPGDPADGGGARGREALLASSEHRLPPGETTVSLDLPPFAPRSWSPDDPHLHALAVTLDDGGRHTWRRRFGLRTFAVEGDRLVLNGAPIRPRGVLFQPFWPATLCRPPGPEWMAREMRAIKAAGFDLVRCHVRSLPELYAVCDEIGLLVQAEPTLGWVTQIRPGTADLVDAVLVQLARDVGGHPSVVMVGLLNELSGELHRRSDALLARARELLPGHLLLDDSGSWSGSSHYWNPGADAPVPYDDLHVYRAWPWSATDVAWLADLGADHDRLILVSEHGYGGLPSFAANLAGYRGALDTPDAREHARQLAEAEAALASPRSGVAGVVAGLDELQRLGQENQSRAASALVAALRGNPRVAADVYTQWRDVMWEDGAGLVDAWGGAKPALAAFTALNGAAAPPPPPWDALAPPEPGPAGDGSPPDGVEILGRNAAPWGPDDIAATLSRLRWTAAGGTLLMLVPPDAGRPLDLDMFGYGGFGAVADLPFDARVRSARGHFVGKHLVFAEGSGLLQGFGDDRLFDARFGAVRPATVLDVRGVEGLRVELGAFDGYGLPLGAAVAVVPYGAGHIVFSTLPLGEAAEGDPGASGVDPVVARMRSNVVALAARVAAGKPAPPAREPAEVPPELAARVGELVWQHKNYYGLAERLAWQSFNGRRPQRRELDDLEGVIANQQAALADLVAGRLEEGRTRLQRIEEGPLRGPRELFARAEVQLATRYRDLGVRPALPVRLRIGELHARALAAMRDEKLTLALGLLRAAENVVSTLSPAAPEGGPPDEEPEGGTGAGD